MKIEKSNLLITCLLVLFVSVNVLAFDGIYAVPIDNIAAKNRISGVELSGSGWTRQLHYDLPEDLIGPDSIYINLSLKEVVQGSRGPQYIFTHDATKAVCEGQRAGLTCKIDYQSMDVDKQKRDNFLMQKYAQNPSFLAEKLHVAAVFGSDPVGILQIFCGQLDCGL